ncbi:MAG: alpha-amylase family glycosyl hydrolase [Candidatus Moduliflexus flocculans]|nr:alpha-amylase family glycosyl hydrolase [Candidatus Moduliflexus flocculans]
MDYRAVDPELGGWKDVQALGRGFQLAFDLVINHASSRGAWFRGFLGGDPRFEAMVSDPAGVGYDASGVVRPRTYPLLTPYARAGRVAGERLDHLQRGPGRSRFLKSSGAR